MTDDIEISVTMDEADTVLEFPPAPPPKTDPATEARKALRADAERRVKAAEEAIAGACRQHRVRLVPVAQIADGRVSQTVTLVAED
jgi:hypothetical protein